MMKTTVRLTLSWPNKHLLAQLWWLVFAISWEIAIATNPDDNTQWCDADKPFQVYAACMEYRQALLSGNPETFVSRIPIALDGSCSGIQNLSLAFRDPVGSAAVNILPSEKPSDIYQLVADKTVIRLKEIAVSKCPEDKMTQEDDKPSDAELAQWWLDYGVTRKITKRNCMTFPYGCPKMS